MGIGLSRHENGGMTCRAIACLPALTGAYAHPHGGALLGSSGTFGPGDTVLERRDLLPSPPPRTINMVQLGRALTDPDLRPPVMALYVYNSNPAAVCPNSSLVLEGLAREDLFTVVHEQVQTDTADYADLLLPATTSMEHTDVYRSFGHLYLQLAEPVIAPRGEARTNWEVFGAAGPCHGDAATATTRRRSRSSSTRTSGPRVRSPTASPTTRLRAERSARIAVPRPFLPFADGAPTPSGRVEFYSETLARQGLPALPTYVPLRESLDDPAIGLAVPPPLPRAAEPVLPQLVVQPVGAAPGAAGRADGARPSRRRGRPGRSARETSSRCSTTGGGRSSRPSCRTTRSPARW